MALIYASQEDYDALVARMARRREAIAAIAALKASAAFRAMSRNQRLAALKPLQAIAREPALATAGMR